MTLKEKLDKIAKLQEHKLPFEAMRVFGEIHLFGDQITFGEDNDYVSLNDARGAIDILVAELGGKVKWSKNKA